MSNKNATLKNQSGAATLLVAIILLIGITLIALFATRIGILDQKISGNEYRHKEAFANAEAGLEQAASYLRANPTLHDSATSGWASCAGLTSVFPCDVDGAEFVFATVSASTISSSVDMLPNLPNSQGFLVKKSNNTIAVGEGASADGTGSAIAMIEYAETSLLTPGEIPPLMSPEVDLSGSFTIVPNPNGGGPGVPVSAWVKSTDSSGGSWQTCQHGEFQDTGQVCIDTYDDTDNWKVCGCTADGVLSDSGDIGSDIVIDDPSEFPYSSFAYVFNEYIAYNDADAAAKVEAKKEEIYDRAEAKGKVIPDCSSISGPPTMVDGDLLESLDEPLIWVEGNCSFPSGSTVIIGSRDTPVIMVVEGDVKANGTLDVFGILIGLSDFQLNGNTVVHGSAISEYPSDLTNGSYAQVYDESVFAAFSDGLLTTDISKVKYSWRDFEP